MSTKDGHASSVSTEDNHVPAVPRRRVLAAGAGIAAVAAVGVTGVTLATSGGSGTVRPAAGDGPIVVHVRDLSSGILDVFSGTAHHEVRDRDLAVRLAKAAGH